MCGIAGVVEAEGSPSRELLERMGQAITHRGPDDGRVEVFGRAGFSFRRLSIIDVAGGGQPISNETGRIHVMANGEIYNYLDLRRELEALGHRFKTHSDVETIVHGYEQWGDDVPKHLHGMFAFAIWDEDVRGRELPDGLESRGGRRHVLIGQVIVNRMPVDLARDAPVREDRPKFAPEGDPASRLRVDERLLSEPIAPE
jgi:glutamine phosphoribosylpyrophosphate amidotransferase